MAYVLIRRSIHHSFISWIVRPEKGRFDGNLGRSIHETAHPWTERPARRRTDLGTGSDVPYSLWLGHSDVA